MSQRELFSRWAAALSRQPLRGGNRRELIGGLARVDKLQRDGLLHVFTGPHTVEQITAAAMAFASRSKLGLIVVDYLQAVVTTKYPSLDAVVVFDSAKQAADVAELRTQRRTSEEMESDSSDSPRTNAGSARRRCGGKTQLDELDGLPDAFVAQSRTVLRDNGGGRR
jgi:hypothetical protein